MEEPNIADKDFDLKEYWNSEYMNPSETCCFVKKSQCRNCWKMEAQEIVSLRLNRLTDMMGQEAARKMYNIQNIEKLILKSLLELKLQMYVILNVICVNQKIVQMDV